LVDLHTHSTFSDGTCSPAEIISLAVAAGLSAVALTDHNTVSGLPSFNRAAKQHQIDAVSGVEFSTDYDNVELHILGLFIPPEHYADVSSFLNTALLLKEESNLSLIASLNRAGLSLDYTKIKSETPGGLVNRAVIGAEMKRLGYVSSVQEAFSLWLSPKHGYFTPPKRLNCFDTIRFIKSIGGVAVLAHPFLNLAETELRIFLPLGVSAGLDGMETLYSKYDAPTSSLSTEIAREFRLLESGGSDFHGENKPDTHIAIGKGSLAVPDEFFYRLRERAR